MRQLLAQKVSGNLVGLWLLVPEHLRLRSWDLLCGWSGQSPSSLAPRLALQLVHEAALCSGMRESRCLSQRGFELANGLSFVAGDRAIHDLLAGHTVAEAQALQVALGRLRRASGHYRGNLLAVDPHHLRSYTQRQTRRHRRNAQETAVKTSQTFFCLDVDTGEPLACTIGTSARTVTQGIPELLRLARAILSTANPPTTVLADKEHDCVDLFNQVVTRTGFDLLIPQRSTQALQRRLRALPDELFTSPWAGFAVATVPFRFASGQGEFPLYQIVQRCGARPDDYTFQSFLSTSPRSALQALIRDYPKRWQIGVSSQGHIKQSVKDRPRLKDSGLVAWEASWRESKTVKPSDTILRKECAQRTRLQRAVNADVASLHAIPVAETVDNVRRQQGPTERSPMRRFSPAGYQRRHGVKEDVSTGETLGARRRKLVEEGAAITVSGKCSSRHQGDGSGCSTVDGRAAKRARREGPGPVSVPSVKGRQG